MRLLEVQHGHSLDQLPLSEATNDGHAHLYEFSRFWPDLQIIDPVILLGKLSHRAIHKWLLVGETDLQVIGEVAFPL